MIDRTVHWLGRALPIAGWLPTYQSIDFGRDVAAGLTVGVMLIPQGMAYAVIAGLPPIYGLYAALVPLLVYPLLGTSRQLVTGPVAIDMLIVAAGVGALAEAGTPRYIALAIGLAGLVGLVQVGMGLMRLGFLADLLSRPVIAGFTAAAALIIAGSQLGNLLGVELGRSMHLYALGAALLQQIDHVHGLSLGVGMGSAGVLLGLRRWASGWPAALVVVLGATGLSWAAGWAEAGVAVIGTVPTGLPAPDAPPLAWGDLRRLLPTALTLALVQFMNVVSLGRVFAARHDASITPNRELLAIGAANVVGSLFRSVPVSGSFSRTAVNDQAGARSPLANVVAAALVALTLLFLTPLFHHLPMPALAALIIVAAAGLIDGREGVYLFRTRKREGFIALFTFGATLFIGIQAGILLGIGASIVAMLYRVSRPNVAELGHLQDTRSFHDVARFEQAHPIDGLLVLRVNAAFSFANAEYFKDFILAKSTDHARGLRAVIIDGASINDLDTTALEALDDIVDQLQARGIALYFTGLIGPVRDLMRRSGFYDRLGPDHFCANPHDAVTFVLARRDAEDEGDRLGTYLGATVSSSAELVHAGS